MARYWQNFRDLREAKGLSQEAVAQRLGITRQGNLSVREKRDQRVPKPQTIRRHAKALGCKPADLLRGVITEYDAMRGDLSSHAAIGVSDPHPDSARVLELKAKLEELEAFIVRIEHTARSLWGMFIEHGSALFGHGFQDRRKENRGPQGGLEERRRQA